MSGDLGSPQIWATPPGPLVQYSPPIEANSWWDSACMSSLTSPSWGGELSCSRVRMYLNDFSSGWSRTFWIVCEKASPTSMARGNTRTALPFGGNMRDHQAATILVGTVPKPGQITTVDMSLYAPMTLRREMASSMELWLEPFTSS